jgi:hypothetical protein
MRLENDNWIRLGLLLTPLIFPLLLTPCAAFEAGVYYIGTQDSEGRKKIETLRQTWNSCDQMVTCEGVDSFRVMHPPLQSATSKVWIRCPDEKGNLTSFSGTELAQHLRNESHKNLLVVLLYSSSAPNLRIEDISPTIQKLEYKRILYIGRGTSSTIRLLKDTAQ